MMTALPCHSSTERRRAHSAQPVTRRIGRIYYIGLILYFALYARTSKALAAPPPATSSAQVSATIPALAVANDTTAPSAPVLIAPTDGTITSEVKIEFTWKESSDPDSNTVIYTLYLNGVATYLGISGNGSSEGAGYTARIDGDEIKLVPTTTIPSGEYNWSVAASDLAGNTSNSASWHLTIDREPPTILVTDIDTYHNLHLSSTDPASVPPGTSFDLNGPKDMYFTVATEPYATVTVRLDSPAFGSTPYRVVSAPSGTSGIAHPYIHLSAGSYTVEVSAVDHAGQPTALPPFSIVVHESVLTIPLPGISPPPTYIIPGTLTSLPSTISYVATRINMAVYIATSLAVIGMIVLIFLWNRRYNLIMVDEQNTRVRAVVYHSRPGLRGVRASRTPAMSAPTGRLFIPHLGRYSTLTIRTNRQTTVLSLSREAHVYTIIVE